MESFEVEPGLLHIFSKFSCDAVKVSLKRAQSGLTLYNGYPRSAIHNTINILLYKLGEIKKEDFESVVDAYPQNLNAWENNRLMYEHQGSMENVQRCASRLKDILTTKELSSARSDLSGPMEQLHVGLQPNRDVALEKVRCLLEKGFAQTCALYAFDSPDEEGTQQLTRHIFAKNYFETALEDDRKSSLLDDEERRQWKFLLAQSLHTILRFYYNLGGEPTERSCLPPRGNHQEHRCSVQSESMGSPGYTVLEKVCHARFRRFKRTGAE